MTGRLLRSADFCRRLCFGLAGCSVPIGWYHECRSGAIRQQRQPPPGSDQPYPNLANVRRNRRHCRQRCRPAFPPLCMGPQPASRRVPGRLAGLDCQAHRHHCRMCRGWKPCREPVHTAVPAAPPAPPPPNGPPIALGFPPHSSRAAVYDIKPIEVFAKARGGANILVGALAMAPRSASLLARAQRLADALTATAVPPGAIRLGCPARRFWRFAQLVY